MPSELPVAVSSTAGVEKELASVGLVIIEVGFFGFVARSGFPIGEAVDGIRRSDGDDDDVIVGLGLGNLKKIPVDFYLSGAEFVQY